MDDELLTATAKLEADIRHLVTRSGGDKDWARIAGWQDQVRIIFESINANSQCQALDPELDKIPTFFNINVQI